MSETTNFNPPNPLNTAVLFLVFNRLDTTKQVFETIRQAKPPRLYIAADGARANKEGEFKKVNAVRDYILQNIDWDCEIKTLFRDQNLGCKYAVSGAITWFFENEEQGIILEDDCLPSPSFFGFCEVLLEKYKNDLMVWHIGGTNFLNGSFKINNDYYFSKHNHVWGWASWRDRWAYYDVELSTYSDLSYFSLKPKWLKYWTKIFDRVQQNEIDTWDFQWTYTMWSRNGISIIPRLNLISNLGFGAGATHTKKENNKLSKQKVHKLILESHPNDFIIRQDLDDFIFNKFNYKSKFILILNKVKSLFLKLF